MARNSLQKSLGEVFRQYREELGISQEEFAYRVGLHRTYVGSVERGERNISIQNMEQIAKELKVPLSKLIEYAEKLK